MRLLLGLGVMLAIEVLLGGEVLVGALKVEVVEGGEGVMTVDEVVSLDLRVVWVDKMDWVFELDGRVLKLPSSFLLCTDLDLSVADGCWFGWRVKDVA